MTQEIHFVTGKGGTGKSVIAAGLALREAQKGRSVLLVELNDRSFYREFFEIPEIGYEPKSLTKNLDVALWTGAECLQEYATHLVKVETLTKLLFQNKVSRSLIDIAPALKELAILGKATSGPRKHGPPAKYDVLVIDAYATGHFLALLRAPAGMAQAVSFGPMGEQSRSIDKILRDPKICKTHVVCLPEEMPVQETAELVASLRSEFSIQPEIILNKMLQVPDGLEASSQDDFSAYLRRTDVRQKAILEKVRSMSKDTQCVPFLFEENGRDLQKSLAEVLR